MKFLFLLCLFTLPALACEDHPSTAKSFGKGVTSKEPAIGLSQALGEMAKHQGQEIVVKAKVKQVCQAKGCWMVLQEGKDEVRITFHKYSFFVPKSAAGKTTIAQGKIFQKEISASEARHYARDAGLHEKEVAAIQSPQSSPWFEATGLTLQD